VANHGRCKRHSLSHSESGSRQPQRQREESCDIAMQYATPAFTSDEPKAVTVSAPEGSRTETPFRPITEALDPYRAGNRCALNSLDTDRSKTLSPETVTANRVLRRRSEISHTAFSV
jgi:hypothetical protein